MAWTSELPKREHLASLEGGRRAKANRDYYERTKVKGGMRPAEWHRKLGRLGKAATQKKAPLRLKKRGREITVRR